MKKILTAFLSLSISGFFAIPAIQALAETTDPAGTVVIYGPNYDNFVSSQREYISAFGEFNIKNGEWGQSSLPDKDHDACETKGSVYTMGAGSAEWIPKQGILNGKYAVYVYNVRRDNYSDKYPAECSPESCDTDVTYTVAGNKEKQTIHVNQLTDSGEKSGWVYLCTDEFDGVDDSVTITVTNTDTRIYTNAKDVKFVPVGEQFIVASDENGNVINGRIGNGKIGAAWSPSDNVNQIVPSKEITAAIEAKGGSGVINYYQNAMPNSAITFKPVIPAYGKYKVLVWQAYNIDNYEGTPQTLDASVVCTENNGGPITVSGIPYKAVKGHPKWIEIGEYFFNSKDLDDPEAGFVELTTSNANTTDIRLQAVKFIPIREVTVGTVEIVTGSIYKEYIAGDNQATGFFARITTGSAQVSKFGVVIGNKRLETGITPVLTNAGAVVKVLIDGIAKDDDIVVYVQ